MELVELKNRTIVDSRDSRIIDSKFPVIVRYREDRDYMSFLNKTPFVKVNGKKQIIPNHTGKHSGIDRYKYFPGMTYVNALEYELVPTTSIQHNLNTLYATLGTLYNYLTSVYPGLLMWINSSWRHVQAVPNQAKWSFHLFGGAADISFSYKEPWRGNIIRPPREIYITILKLIIDGKLPYGELFLYNGFIHYAPTNTVSATSFDPSGNLTVGRFKDVLTINQAIKYVK